MSDKPTSNFTDTGLGVIMAKQTAVLLCIKEKKTILFGSLCKVFQSCTPKRQYFMGRAKSKYLVDSRFLNNTPFYRLMHCLCREFVENDDNNWHLRSQCLPLKLISAGVNPMPLYNLSDSATSVLAGLGGVRKPCQCVSQFNSIKHRFKLQIKMQITSVIKVSESTGRDKVHPSLLLPALMKYKPLFNVKLNLILRNKVSQSTLSHNRFCPTCVMFETKGNDGFRACIVSSHFLTSDSF